MGRHLLSREVVGQPYERGGRMMVLVRERYDEEHPIVSRDSSTVIGWVRRIDWQVRDVPLEALTPPVEGPSRKRPDEEQTHLEVIPHVRP
jgi:hypothetical protein